MHWTQRIRLKSPREVELMAAAGRDLVTVFMRLREGQVRVGVTTSELDRLIERFMG